MNFETIFSTDADFKQSNLIVIMFNGELYGFHPIFDESEQILKVHSISLDAPDWTNLKDLKAFSGVNYGDIDELKDDELYNYISDVISYYGAHEFDYTPNQYTVNECEEICEGGYEYFDNEDFVKLMF